MLALQWNKEIQFIQLSYFREWRFEKSYLIIHFNFKNAVWYQLKDIKRINCSSPIILNLDNIEENIIELIVFGLLENKKYLIDITKDETLINNNFKTSISKINTIQQISSEAKLKIKQPIIDSQNFNIASKEIQINNYPLQITFKKFNQKEYI